MGTPSRRSRTLLWLTLAALLAAAGLIARRAARRRQADRQTDRQPNPEADRQADHQTNRQPNPEADHQTNPQPNPEMGRQADRQVSPGVGRQASLGDGRHLEDGAQAGAALSPAVTAAEAKPGPTTGRGLWVPALAVVAVIALCAGVLIGRTTRPEPAPPAESSAPPSGSAPPAESSARPATPPAEVTPSPSAAPLADGQDHPRSETLALDGDNGVRAEFRIAAVQESPETRAAPGKRLLSVTLDIRSTGTRPVTEVPETYAWVVDSLDRPYRSDRRRSAALNVARASRIDPGRDATRTIVFEVPAGARVVRFRLWLRPANPRPAQWTLF